MRRTATTRLMTGAVATLIAVITGGVVAVGSATGARRARQEALPTGKLARLLDDGHAVFGLFAREKTPEEGAELVENRDADFIFYSMETGPFDVPRMDAFMRGMLAAASSAGTHPTALRIPPIRDGRDQARERVAEALAVGVDAIVYPHVETAEEAALAVEMIGDAGWPANPDGKVINVLLIEDRVGVANARDIVSTPGVSVVIPGPGDLGRAYDRDREAVEGAIQTVLAACKEFDVPCGITAGVDDITERLDQGFRMIIASRPDPLPVGRRHVGR